MATPTSTNRIKSFEGKYRFLSNFWPCKVVLDGVIYPSTEHAYQAAKTHNIAVRFLIRDATSAGAAKKTAKKLIVMSELEMSFWNKKKDDVMLGLLRQKFSHGSQLADRLLSTGSDELIEGNWWGDVYWGVCKGVGKNRLGILLMQVREELHSLQLIAHGK